ncbi:NAD(P)H-dependent oxidoreductase [Methylobacterium sp. E-025]|uniref:NAD(P)H-dependent oxidoreductase n=1 Tax=unclassified Methylobacterium TaxID=2615210 RepID=UPI001FBBF900|nr:MULTISPECIES: NAD(P)H-dependent oxidoreductase [unclassified Methylobacterium]MCJ2009923.1 NAD(P)H-dependent oxidoreductase [Methylobacterium sp. J-092]MCJ2042051.1 NAD(P)H-dependent oxidoreductase [Methylobacterium sp. J-059]MCJ2111982.1 NAD(P)H-dependent oxidoreductase [Methylobacterium sp. E-025]
MTRPKLVGFSANLQRPSKTRALVEAVAEAATVDGGLDLRLFDLVDAGTGLGAAWSRDALSLPARRVIEAIEGADALVVGSPVYKGSFTGLFKHVFDLIDPAALANKPVAIVATGGGARHALVVEHSFRPLFGFFGALQVPTTVYGSDPDFTDGLPTDAGVRERIAQAGAQLAALLRAGIAAESSAPVALAAAR